jgi:hypothetical protein
MPQLSKLAQAHAGRYWTDWGYLQPRGIRETRLAFVMLSKIALAEPQVELLERHGGRRPFERIIQPVPEIAVNKQLLAEQCHQV